MCPPKSPPESSASREQRKTSDKNYPQIEHFRPKIGGLPVANPLLARHVCAGDETLLARVVPMCLTSHTAHNPVGIKCQIADGINSFFFSLEIFGDRRAVWPGQWSVAHKIEIRFFADGDCGRT